MNAEQAHSGERDTQLGEPEGRGRFSPQEQWAVRDEVAAIEPTTMAGQGDVLLVRVASLPAGLSEAPSGEGGAVLARSESTG